MNAQPNAGFSREIDFFAAAITALPPLPRSIQYEDEFSEKIRSIESNASHEQAVIWMMGSSFTLRFEKFDVRIREVVRSFLLMSLVDYAPGTVLFLYRNLRLIAAKTIEEVALADPPTLQRRWANVVIDLAGETQTSLKMFVSFLCNCNFGAWKAYHRDFVSHLPTAQRDPYSVVRAGDCFLGIEEEAQLVRWLDRTAACAATLDIQALQVASLVLCSYQFGMRPIQLGLLRKRDCTIRFSGEGEPPVAYLTFRLAKQRNALASRLPLLRKVKNGWAPLVVNLFNALKNESTDSFFFGFRSRVALSLRLVEKLNEILPGQGRVAYDLRHSLV